METKTLKDKIGEGLDKAFNSLVAKKKMENGVFVFSQNGKILTIKAKDIK